MRIEQHMKHSPLNLDILLMYSITCWMEEWKMEDRRMNDQNHGHTCIASFYTYMPLKVKKPFNILMHICYYCVHTAYIGLHVCTYILAYWPYKIQLTSLAVLSFPGVQLPWWKLATTASNICLTLQQLHNLLGTTTTGEIGKSGEKFLPESN